MAWRLRGSRAARRLLPLQRADQPEVLVAELGLLAQAEGEGGDDLVPVGAGDQIIVPEDSESPCFPWTVTL